MVGGLAFQVLSLLLFMALATEFALNVRRDRRAERGSNPIISKEARNFNGHSEKSFKNFLFGKFILFPRSRYVLTEKSLDFDNDLDPHPLLLSCC